MNPGKVSVGFALLLAAVGMWLIFAMTGHPPVLNPKRDIPAAVLFENVRLVSMVESRPAAEPFQAVLVVGDRIEAVAPAGALLPPEGALVVDGGGATLLPGMIDAHVHVWDEAELAGYLAHGVTGIRNLSGMPFHLPLAQRIQSGKILGPDFLTSGPILNSPGPNQQDNHQLVMTADEAKEAVQSQYDAGYRLLKIYSNLKLETYQAILNEAERLGMQVAGHTPEGERGDGVPHEHPFKISFEDALSRNLQTIEHVESIVWHGLRDELDEDAMRKLASDIAASRTAVTPTLIAHDNLVRVAASKGAYLNRPGVDTINPFLLFMDKGTRDFWSAQDPEKREAPRAAFYLKATRMLHEAGVPLIAGSDAGIFTNIPGSALVRELELLVKAGLSPHEALESATRISASTIGFEKTGQIAPGFRANLILVQEDPLEDISSVEYPSGVMVGGYWLDEPALERLRKGARQTSFFT